MWLIKKTITELTNSSDKSFFDNTKKKNRRQFLGLVTAGTGLSMFVSTEGKKVLAQPIRQAVPSVLSFKLFHDEIISLPVWDTHNHLDERDYLCARSFWDMAHYFWFIGELNSSGYPQLREAMKLDGNKRAELFIKAYNFNQATMWHQIFNQTMKDLWNVEITDVKSVIIANEKIAETGKSKDWARKVCAKIAIEKLNVVNFTDNGLLDIKDLIYQVDGEIDLFSQVQKVLSATDQRSEADSVVQQITSDIEAKIKKNIRVFRIVLPRSVKVNELKTKDNTAESINNYIGNTILEALNKNQAHLQIFVGVERDPLKRPNTIENLDIPVPHALNNPNQIYVMHPFFRKYPKCTFEIYCAAQLSNLDIALAAGLFPNVIPGGMWWFNFRRSVLHEVMQYRIESLPPTRCTFMATDAYGIEWLYCKILAIKEEMARFLWKQITDNYIDRETALFVAKEWLYGTASRYYI